MTTPAVRETAPAAPDHLLADLAEARKQQALFASFARRIDLLDKADTSSPNSAPVHVLAAGGLPSWVDGPPVVEARSVLVDGKPLGVPVFDVEVNARFGEATIVTLTLLAEHVELTQTPTGHHRVRVGEHEFLTPPLAARWLHEHTRKTTQEPPSLDPIELDVYAAQVHLTGASA